MQAKHGILEIKNAIKREIAEALNETWLTIEIEISEMNINDAYSVKGAFKIVTFLSSTVKRKGIFESKLDENLKIVSLKITENQQ